jgi:hypothetical protein
MKRCVRSPPPQCDGGSSGGVPQAARRRNCGPTPPAGGHGAVRSFPSSVAARVQVEDASQASTLHVPRARVCRAGARVCARDTRTLVGRPPHPPHLPRRSTPHRARYMSMSCVLQRIRHSRLGSVASQVPNRTAAAPRERERVRAPPVAARAKRSSAGGLAEQLDFHGAAEAPQAPKHPTVVIDRAPQVDAALRRRKVLLFEGQLRQLRQPRRARERGQARAVEAV